MKKKFVVLALVAMLVCGGAFAAPPMYAGVEMGTGSHGLVGVGFEIVPVFGFSPISSMPDLAFEINLMMDFYDGASVVAPQVLAVYTFLDGPIRPFFGMGIGVNINTITVGNSSDTKGAFSWVVKGGAIVPIGSSPVDALALVRYNVNSYEKMDAGHIGVDLGLRVRF